MCLLSCGVVACCMCVVMKLWSHVYIQLVRLGMYRVMHLCNCDVM